MNPFKEIGSNFRGRALFLTCGDPWEQPTGGQGTFARNMLKVFADKLFVVGLTSTRSHPGELSIRTFGDKNVPFLSLGRICDTRRKRLLPRRLSIYLRARIGLRWIRRIGIPYAFIQTPEIILATRNEDWSSVCYRSAGVENPVLHSRFSNLRFLGPTYERAYFKALRQIHPDLILASASIDKIEAMQNRSKGLLDGLRIIQFPTRVDTEVFFPREQGNIRESLGIDTDMKVFCTCGRLSWVKGWRLLLESFKRFHSHNRDSIMIFIGSGEDESLLRERIAESDLDASVIITGFITQEKVSDYLNAADVCLVGSVIEGWSLAMLEMIACGKPIVSTRVSGTDAMIRHGINGFVVDSRDPVEFSNAMQDALKLENAAVTSTSIAKKFSVSNLRPDLTDLWPPLA